MNLPDSIRQYIHFRQPDFPALSGVQVYCDGEAEIADPPMIVIDETGSARVQQDGVEMEGVTMVSISVQLHTIPASDGAHPIDARAMQRAMYDIIGDKNGMIAYINGRNNSACLDIFKDSPIMSADEGRRVSTVNLEILTYPI